MLNLYISTSFISHEKWQISIMFIITVVELDKEGFYNLTTQQYPLWEEVQGEYLDLGFAHYVRSPKSAEDQTGANRLWSIIMSETWPCP